MYLLTSVTINLSDKREYIVYLEDEKIVLEGYSDTDESDCIDLDDYWEGASRLASQVESIELDNNGYVDEKYGEVDYTKLMYRVRKEVDFKAHYKVLRGQLNVRVAELDMMIGD